jgi:PST family polysaccharide transporter
MKETDSFARFSRTDDVRANLKQKSIRGAVFMASGNAADVFVRLGSIAILARLLMPEDFGLIAMVLALTSILDGFRDFGLSAATVQRPNISHRQVSNLFWMNVAVGVVLASIVALAAPLIATFYQESRLVGISVALSLVFVWNGLAVQHEALLVRQLRQGELTLIRLAAGVVSVAIAVGLALNDWGYWALVWREILRSAFITSGVWLRCLWVPGLPRRKVGTRVLVRFGSEISLTHVLASLIMHVDKLLIGRLFGAAPVGIEAPFGPLSHRLTTPRSESPSTPRPTRTARRRVSRGIEGPFVKRAPPAEMSRTRYSPAFVSSVKTEAAIGR